MSHRSLARILISLVAAILAGCASPGSTAPVAAPDSFGVLVMAHGGDSDWNQAVLEAVKPLRSRFDLEVAFGMADAESIQVAVRALEDRGVRQIAVVRMFVSGESWFERTEQILGLRDGAPTPPGIEAGGTYAKPEPASGHHSASHAVADSPAKDNHAAHGSHSMAFWRICTSSTFALSRQGLSEAREMGQILLERARTLSRNPAEEDVMVLAHGPGDDAENARWLERIGRLVESVREGIPFRRVEVQTLREDWPEKRKPAEERIRAFVERAKHEGGRAVVIPFRLQGFGPYREVLAGLDYVSDGRGLLPHEVVTRWIEAQIDLLQGGAFRDSLGPEHSKSVDGRQSTAPAR